MPFHWGNDVIYDDRKDDYWDSQVFVSGTSKNGVDAGAVGGTMVAVEFTRSTPAGTREDRAMFTLHLSAEALAGTAGTRLGTADMTAAEVDLDSWHTAMKPSIAAAWTLAGYTWRDFLASNPLGKTGLSQYGPIKRQTVRSVVGTDAGIPLPYQVASTITLRTGSRRHWGRCYIPGLSATALGSNGRISATYRGAALTAFRDLINALYANSVATDVVVWSAKYRGLLGISEIHVDDVPDIIRRRRPKQTAAVDRFTS